MLIGLGQKAPQRASGLYTPRPRTTTLPADRGRLTGSLSLQRNVVSPLSPWTPVQESEPQGKPLGQRVKDEGESERHPVIGWIGAAPFRATSPRAQASRLPSGLADDLFRPFGQGTFADDGL